MSWAERDSLEASPSEGLQWVRLHAMLGLVSKSLLPGWVRLPWLQGARVPRLGAELCHLPLLSIINSSILIRYFRIRAT